MANHLVMEAIDEWPLAFLWLHCKMQITVLWVKRMIMDGMMALRFYFGRLEKEDIGKVLIYL